MDLSGYLADHAIDVRQAVIHIAVVLMFPPLLWGVINKTKAWFGGRVGPPLLQSYYDLWRLIRKGSVFSHTTTWIFRAGPVVGLTTVLAASLLVPLGSMRAPLSFTGDLVMLLYLFALGRFFTVSAALDTGSAFEGMGGSREVSYAAMAEPALLMGLMVLVRLSGKLQLAEMFADEHAAGVGLSQASLLLVIISWFIVLLAENCRIPFDDPNTHLELTMIHEVIVLDHSGPALAMILYGATIKLLIFSALVLRLVVPWRNDGGVLDWFAFVAATLALAVGVGIVESVMARLRLLDIPKLLVAAGVLSAFGLVLVNQV
jgi:formate hydrogenlyase subunit 4